jgi:mono/diheme cytochrome c family protein
MVLTLFWRGQFDAASTLDGGTALDIASGKSLYQENCAVCHGDNLQGQRDWQVPNEDGSYPAPPHDETGHTWHHRDDMLFAYVKRGGAKALEAQGITSFKSAMPGFSDRLNDHHIREILAYIASTWPDRIIKIRKEQNTGTQSDG